MSYTFHRARGLYVRKLKRQGRAHALVRKRDMRGAVTHVGLICERSEIQPKLPQVVIGNTHRFTLGLMASVAASKPDSVHLFRRKSSWNSASCMCEILELLAASLRDFPGFQPILLLDTCSCHVTDTVAAKAAALNIWLVPVPAGLTHLLQPLDVYTFSGYKQFLQNAHKQARADHGDVDARAWLQLIFDVCTRFLNGRRWSEAFCQVGLGPSSASLSHELKTLFPGGLPVQQATCLSAAELARLMPKGRKFRALHWVRAPKGRRRVLTIR